MESNLLPVADAIATRLGEVITPIVPTALIAVTWNGLQVPVKDLTVLKVFVVPASDAPAPRSQGGHRGDQPLNYRYAIAFCERYPSTVQGVPARDAWVRQRVELVGKCRAALDNPRGFNLPGLEALGLAPVESSEREAADPDELMTLGLFAGGFNLTIREDP